MGVGGDLPGAKIATCKIAGIAYEGPMNLALAPNGVGLDGPGRSTCTSRYGLNRVNYDRSVGGRGFPTVSVTRLVVQWSPLPRWRCRHGNFTGGRWHQGSKAPPSLA
jgi:hypothetical protein